MTRTHHATKPAPGTAADASTAPPQPEGIEEAPQAEPREPVLLDMPRDGVPEVVTTAPGLARAARAIAAGTGPVSVDAERASGFRYGQRAFLVQLRREGSGSWLIDPVPFENLDPIQEAIGDETWILHAASQDLPCLRELGLEPARLFDTELAARIAGLPRVGLGPAVESLLGLRLAKEHSAADWSTRPLPEPWLRYAALDVEVLDQLRIELIKILQADGKLEYAEQEFEAVRTAPPAPPRVDPWRRTSGLHQIRDRRTLAAVRALWETRESLARTRDTAPGRLIPDSALVAAAKAMPKSVPALLKTPGFHGRSASKDAPKWLRALQDASTTSELPPNQVPSNSPPPPKVWADKDPVAAARLQTARARVARTAESLNIPMENLLTPDTLRRLCWNPPAAIDPDTVADALRALGARAWQIDLVGPVLTVALLDPDELAKR
ncbi:ribonuclease D [Paeniglutamicibacter psychrophenolicus]|uniref:ribonuclease D n=1 Tax=Paeniglutamicibacter psychrophenolicus TaxID=257454 RepID=UPI0027811C7E|nr:ribonuclease D [Paeniglutamicibacter psychrophenolicus]MDQ0094485.1 ribonuclease D [Paeniglutamicibacter psychrophenolicus]